MDNFKIRFLIQKFELSTDFLLQAKKSSLMILFSKVIHICIVHPKMHAGLLTCVVNSNEQKTLTESRNSFLTIKERPQMCGELGVSSDFHVYKSSKLTLTPLFD